MGWVADCSDDPPTGELYRSQIAGENNASVDLSDRSTARPLIRPAFDRFEGLLVASGSGLMVRRRFRDRYPQTSALCFVSGDLVPLAVTELLVVVPANRNQ